MNRRVCSVEGCGREVEARGWCVMHYARWRKRGHPGKASMLRAKRGEAMGFLLTTVLNYAGEECLLWPFAKNYDGYGQVSLNHQRESVHRIVCEYANGPPPTPHHRAAHSCGKGHLGCVAKKHLRWATPMENSADMILHGTSTRGKKNANHKLSAEQVRLIRSLKGRVRYFDIADRFNISISTISLIQQRKTWAWLPDDDQ